MFQNYEHVKLDIFKPDYVNLIIICTFFMSVMLTIKKIESNAFDNKFLGMLHTDQLRGIAIFFVVLGHLWDHVSKTNPQIILSRDSVSLFLLISGFGLQISTINKIVSFKDFFLKRIKKVMVPYWTVTLFIVILDYLILDRTLDVGSLMMTVFGINTKLELFHIDYARWFVTFILLWYLIFYFIFLNFNSKYILFVAPFALLPVHYYLLKIGWCQFFSFPAGCFLAIYRDRLIVIYKKNNLLFIILAISGIQYFIFYKILISYNNINVIVNELIPNIFLAYYSEFNALIFSFSFLILVGKSIEMGFKSNVLIFLGKYSYEIFLLHGVFLIKYNPIVKSQSTLKVSFEFLLLFLFVTIISMLTYKMHHSRYGKKTV